jgi:Mlc titration factor MtfA (ptsG expression regulator)
VATEQFFATPVFMINNAPDLSRVRQEDYRQEPALPREGIL